MLQPAAVAQAHTAATVGNVAAAALVRSHCDRGPAGRMTDGMIRLCSGVHVVKGVQPWADVQISCSADNSKL
jgi:hypothetical protein